MPDVLAGDAAYRLVEIGCVTLPEGLTSVAGRGPDDLNFGTHPLAPSLLRIGGVGVLAMRRPFGQLDFHAAPLTDQWILAICPTRTRVKLG